jgi:hypothetical protein
MREPWKGLHRRDRGKGYARGMVVERAAPVECLSAEAKRRRIVERATPVEWLNRPLYLLTAFSPQLFNNYSTIIQQLFNNYSTIIPPLSSRHQIHMYIIHQGGPVG